MVYWQLLHLLTLNATSSSRDLCSSDDQKLERSIRKGSLHTCHTSCTLYLRLFTGDRASVKANIPALCSLEEMKLHSLLVCSLLCILHSLWNCKGKKKKKCGWCELNPTVLQEQVYFFFQINAILYTHRKGTPGTYWDILKFSRSILSDRYITIKLNKVHCKAPK